MLTIGFFVYEYENDHLPKLFKVMFISDMDAHEQDTHKAITNQLYILIYGTVYDQKSFEYFGVITWNYISQNVQTRCPIGTQSITAQVVHDMR